MTKDLTELWKKGELEGEYYIETHDGKHYVCELQTKSGVKNKRLPLAKSFNGYVSNKSVAEVSAHVPSYNEWKLAYEQLNKNGIWYTERSYKELQKENQKLDEMCKHWSMQETERTMECVKLKELLKECRKALNKAKGDTVWYPVEIDHVITKIDEVLNANVR